MNFRSLFNLTNRVITASASKRSSMGRVINWADVSFKIINYKNLIWRQVGNTNVRRGIKSRICLSKLGISDKLHVTEMILEEL
jgi:hypothetical protein